MAELEFFVPDLGQRTDLPENQIPIRALRECKNVFRGINGTLRLRPGFENLGSALGVTNRIMGIKDFSTAAGAIKIVAGTIIKFFEWDGATWNDVTGATALTGGDTDHVRMSIMPVSGVYKIIATNAVDVPQIWDGTGNFADVGGTPGVSIDNVVVANRLLLLQSPNVVKISDFNNPEAYTNNFTAILADGGDLMVGMGRISRTSAAILGQNSQWVARAQSGSFPFRFERLGDFPGPISSACIVSYGSTIFWLARDYNVYKFNGVNEPVAVGWPMVRHITDLIDITNRGMSHGVYLPTERKIVWWFPPVAIDPTIPTRGIFYDPLTGEMGQVDYPNGISASGHIRVSTGVTYADLSSFTYNNIAATYPTYASFGNLVADTAVALGQSTSAFVAISGSGDGSDAGGTITASWETPLLPYGGWPRNTNPDYFETFFKKTATAQTAKVSVGSATTLGTPPTYSSAEFFDLINDERRDVDLSALGEKRFVSVRHEYFGKGPMEWYGGIFGYRDAKIEHGGVE